MIDVLEKLTPDGTAVVMLCSRLGLSDDTEAVSPLTLKEWNALALRIQESEIKRPSALLGLSAADLSRRLAIAHAEAESIARLLDRGGSVALTLEQLASSGI